jgi:anti-sigma regulatory factor (Ser/Thr protein kinase)
MEPIILKDINTTYESYLKLISLYENIKDFVFSDISIELSDWFAANMSAALGSIVDKPASMNDINISSSNSNIISILQRNGFLAHFGYEKKFDTNFTTIPYLKLKPQESRYFHEYVMSELLSKSELPTMTNQLKKKIAESIYEIFVNAQIHSNTEYIYTCGQFFPVKHKIEFTIVDRGIGFKEKINKRFNAQFNSIQAIKWAIRDGNSTKEGVPGGIGLAILQEFIKKNKGKIQIVSDDGFYQLDEQRETFSQFKMPFPGTIINMQFRTDDNSSYGISGETDSSDIF